MTHAGNRPARSLQKNFARLSRCGYIGGFVSVRESIEYIGFSVEETRRKTRQRGGRTSFSAAPEIRVLGTSKEMREESERERERERKLRRQVRKEGRETGRGRRTERKATYLTLLQNGTVTNSD